EAVGLYHVIHDQSRFAGYGVMAEDVAAIQIGIAGIAFFRAGQDAVGRVSEPDRAIGFDNDIVGRVEFLPLIVIHDGDDGSVRLGAGDATPAVFAGNQAALQVERVAVGVIGGLAECLHAAVALVPAQHPVVGDVAPHDIARRDVDRPLGPDAAIRQLF